MLNKTKKLKSSLLRHTGSVHRHTRKNNVCNGNQRWVIGCISIL